MNWRALPLTGVVALSVVLLRRWPLLGLALLLAGSVALRELQVRFLVAAMLLPTLLTGLGACYIAATRSRMRSITAAVLAIGIQVYVIESGSFLFFRFFRLTARPASPCGGGDNASPSPPTSTCPPTASSRRRSPTWPGT
jgi:hypothetical protein